MPAKLIARLVRRKRVNRVQVRQINYRQSHFGDKQYRMAATQKRSASVAFVPGKRTRQGKCPHCEQTRLLYKVAAGWLCGQGRRAFIARLKIEVKKPVPKFWVLDEAIYPSEEAILTVSEVSKYLSLHQSKVYRLLKSGEIPGFRVGSDWRFNKQEIDRWRSGLQPTDGVSEDWC